MKTSYRLVRPTFDVIGLIDLLVLMICNLSLTVSTLHIMPPFVPNQYMLDTHGDKGHFDWEVYAWCIRDAMAKAGGFQFSEQTIRDKLVYERFMLG